MNVHETVMYDNNPFCGYNIPIVSYEYDQYNKLNNDLVTILDDLEEFYLNTKSNNKKTDGSTNTKNVLTNNFYNFNIFDRTEYDTVKDFKYFVADVYKHYVEKYTPFDFSLLKDTYIQCWGNKLEKFDFLDRHVHTNSFNLVQNNLELSANYFVQSPGHDTYTRNYSPVTLNKDTYTPIKNKEGHLTIFPSFVEHNTTANRSSDKYRYTLGMDVINTNVEDIDLLLSYGSYTKLNEHEK